MSPLPVAVLDPPEQVPLSGALLPGGRPVLLGRAWNTAEDRP
ncbi:hypothetical protein [Actinokineospora bangkokensis]|nr:hypothetical protein [Actinokineospora bangkokensis]